MTATLRDELVCVCVTAMLEVAATAKVDTKSARELAQLGKLAGVDLDSHMTDEVALQVDMPLLRQLVGQGAPAAKPKAPAKKSAKGKK